MSATTSSREATAPGDGGDEGGGRAAEPVVTTDAAVAEPEVRRSRSWVGVLNLVLLAAPVVLFAVLAHHHRWISDDGFINLRVVDQVMAGNGPVWNAGDRVEVATSPLWILVVVALRLLTFDLVDTPWLAAGAGVVLSLAGVVMGMAGATALVRAGRVGARVWPAGVFVVVALPPFWDFASSGLELGLTMAWLAGCFWALARRLVAGADLTAAGRRRPPAPRWLPVLLGLGFVIRPDAALYSVAWLAVLLVASRPGWRGRLQAVALALAVPLAYQIFRMGYYGVLVPNTALAKEAGLSNWEQGGVYLRDLLDPYHLWLALALVAVLLATLPLRRWVADGRWGVLVLLVAPVVAGLVHGTYVVKVGGDFMHGRLLLPALFSIALPVMVVPVVAARVTGVVRTVAVVGVAVWALVCAVAWRVPYDGIGDAGVADERDYYAWAADNDTPVSVEDYGDINLARQGRELLRLKAEGQDVALYPTPTSWAVAARPPGSGIVAAQAQIGLVGYMAGSDVTVVDIKGLGDPLAARLSIADRSRPGHEKELPIAWRQARYEPWAVQTPEVLAVRDALGCGDLAEVLDATGAPLTPARFLANVVGSPNRTSLRFDTDGDEARQRFCGR